MTEEAKIERLVSRFDDVETALENLQYSVAELKNDEIPAFCTLELACKLKGGSEYRNLYTRPWQQPCCGTRYQRVNGRKVWPKAEVLRWLQVTDSTLEEYAASLGLDISAHFKNGKNRHAAKKVKLEVL